PAAPDIPDLRPHRDSRTPGREAATAPVPAGYSQLAGTRGAGGSAQRPARTAPTLRLPRRRTTHCPNSRSAAPTVSSGSVTLRLLMYAPPSATSRRPADLLGTKPVWARRSDTGGRAPSARGASAEGTSGRAATT